MQHGGSQTTVNFSSGTIAAIAATLLTQPTDMLRTHMQVSLHDNASLWHSHYRDHPQSVCTLTDLMLDSHHKRLPPTSMQSTSHRWYGDLRGSIYLCSSSLEARGPL